MIDIRIVDAKDSGKKARVTEEGVIPVMIHDHPPAGDDWQGDTFFGRFSDSSGSTEMAVDGSTTPQIFSITASQDEDTWIHKIKIIVSDNGSTLAEFGALSALTNGVEIRRFSRVSGDRTIQDQIKTNLDLVRIGDGPAFGDGTTAFKAIISGSGVDSYLVDIRINELFGFKDGLRLTKGTRESIYFKINDDLTGLLPDGTFSAIAYGRVL